MIRRFLTNIDATFNNPIDNGDTFNSTGETILKTITVGPGEIESDLSVKTLTISMVASKPITNASTYQFKLYYNSANTLTDAFQFGLLNTSSADTTPVMVRTFSLYDTLNSQGLLDSLYGYDSYYDDWGDLNSPLSTGYVYSPQTGTTYFILTGKRTSATSDTVTIKNFVLEL